MAGVGQKKKLLQVFTYKSLFLVLEAGLDKGIQ